MSNLLRLYHKLAGAIADGNVVELRQMIDKGSFRVSLPGSQSELDFTQFVPEMERRRAPFSDFGKNTQIHAVVQEDERIVVHYTMILTHDGWLSDWRGNSAPPSGRKVSLTAIDLVTFNHGKVVGLVTVSDRLATLRQMGSD